MNKAKKKKHRLLREGTGLHDKTANMFMDQTMT
jgi:hypothetical protein